MAETVDASIPTIRAETEDGVRLRVDSTGPFNVTATGIVEWDAVPRDFPGGSATFKIESGELNVSTVAGTTFILLFDSHATVYKWGGIESQPVMVQFEGRASDVVVEGGIHHVFVGDGTLAAISTEGPAKLEVAVSVPPPTWEEEEEVATPEHQEPTAEEKHTKEIRHKTHVVLFLRRKIEKALLTEDKELDPKEMDVTSQCLSKLEGLPNLEVSIIMDTKINEVLKAILKLEDIPKEDEFKFKPRSQALLDKWKELLVAEAASTPAPATDKVPAPDGVNGKNEEPSASSKTEDVAKNKDGDSKLAEI